MGSDKPKNETPPPAKPVKPPKQEKPQPRPPKPMFEGTEESRPENRLNG
jgi:hypothetical protein